MMDLDFAGAATLLFMFALITVTTYHLIDQTEEEKRQRELDESAASLLKSQRRAR